MLELHPNNPFRPCNWRWERARVMRENRTRGLGKRSDDTWILSAYRFQVGLAKCRDDIDRYELMDEFPELYGAYLIYQRGDDDNNHPIRYAIEARLLAAQPEHEIAERLGVTADTVTAYERIFFNVKERLQNTDYIMTCVIGPSVHAGLSDRDYDLLWKLFGYIYGATMLDSFISTTSRKYRPENLHEVDAALADDVRSSLQRKVAIVARTYTVNPFSQSELLNTYARFLEMEKESSSGNSRDVILQNVQVMMDMLPLPRQGLDKPPEQPKLLAHYDNSSVELHTDELLAAAEGNDTLNPDELAQLKFPEPPVVEIKKPERRRSKDGEASK